MGKLLFVSVLFVLCASYISGQVCTTNTDCTGDHGICLSSFDSTGCACLSGFGGLLCDARPDASCAYSPVLANVTHFNPSIAIQVESSTLNLQVVANLEQTAFLSPADNDTLGSGSAFSLGTIIQFGSTPTACDYPSTGGSYNWTHPSALAGSCNDNYQISVPWASAVSLCGFSAASGSHTYSKTVTVTRMYQLPDLGDGVPIYRNESISQVLSVVFPVSVTVSSSISVTGPQAVSVSAVISVTYDPAIDKWTVVLKTFTARPYKLTNPQIASTNGEILSDTRYDNDAVNITGTCTDNSLPCSQTITFQLSQCQALSGDIVVSTIPVCSGGAGDTCPDINSTVLLGMTINTADSCGVVNDIQFSVNSLDSYSTSALTVPKTQFAASDIAYFGAVVESTNASISGLTLQSVCLVYNGEPCTPVQYTLLSDAGGKSPVFAVDLAQTRYFTNDTTAQSFSVQATIGVTWVNAKRDAIQQKNARVNVNTNVSVGPAAVVQATSGDASDLYDASESNVVTAATSLLFILFVLLVL